ncbi:MAG: VTC domain-containing protein [Bryobacteraceae bacterium]
MSVLAQRMPAANGVVFQRYEYKYVIPPDLMEPIRSFLRPYCDMDRYAAREDEKFYTITSLYLDNVDFKTYWDKEAEVPNRFKLRVRTYGRHAEGPVKFEIKRRFNEVSRKTWLEVPRDIWPALFRLPLDGEALALSAKQRSALEDFLGLAGIMRAEPKMLVRYERQAFISRIDRYVRISFDRRLRYQRCDRYGLKGEPFRWSNNDGTDSTDESGSRVILELKFMNSAPVWLVDLVRTFGLMRRGFSKYCTAVTLSLGANRTGCALDLAIPAAGVRMRR